MPLPCEGAEITLARLDRGVSGMSHPARLHDPGAMHHAMPGMPAGTEPTFEEEVDAGVYALALANTALDSSNSRMVFSTS